MGSIVKTNFTIFIFSTFVSVFFSYPANAQSEIGSSYYPLKIGNQWTYETSEYTREITDTVRISGKMYYFFESGAFWRFVFHRLEREQTRNPWAGRIWRGCLRRMR